MDLVEGSIPSRSTACLGGSGWQKRAVEAAETAYSTQSEALWRVRLVVRLPGSQPGDTGSSPVLATLPVETSRAMSRLAAGSGAMPGWLNDGYQR